MNNLGKNMANQDLVFNFGGSVFGDEAKRVEKAVKQIKGLDQFECTVKYGEITVANVSLEMVGAVRGLLQGTQILNGAYTYSQEMPKQ